MDLIIGLYVYVIILVILTLMLYIYGYNGWESIIMSMIVSQVVLIMACKPYEVDNSSSISGQCLYTLINVLTPIIVYIYAFSKAKAPINMHTHNHQ